MAGRRAFEGLEPRTLLSGSIQGGLWDDANGNAVRDTGEAALVGWTVYLDQNRNTVADAGEPTATTDAAGAYRFDGLAAGTYYVAEVLQPAWEQTFPGSGGAVVSGAGGAVATSDLSGSPTKPKVKAAARPAKPSRPPALRTT